MVFHFTTVFVNQLLTIVIGSSQKLLSMDWTHSVCFGTYFWYYVTVLIIGPSLLLFHWLTISESGIFCYLVYRYSFGASNALHCIATLLETLLNCCSEKHKVLHFVVTLQQTRGNGCGFLSWLDHHWMLTSIWLLQ